MAVHSRKSTSFRRKLEMTSAPLTLGAFSSLAMRFRVTPTNILRKVLRGAFFSFLVLLLSVEIEMAGTERFHTLRQIMVAVPVPSLALNQAHARGS
ncbi:hypothetical protein BDW71DRAFT_136002 [Aspergillus fruticulosus]